MWDAVIPFPWTMFSLKYVKIAGHLGASLGVVELTVALHHTFNTPDDKVHHPHTFQDEFDLVSSCRYAILILRRYLLI